MKKLLYRRSVARPFVPRKKNNNLESPSPFFSYGSVERTTGAALYQDRCDEWIVLGWIVLGRMDGWMQRPRRRTRHLPPLTLCLPLSLRPRPGRPSHSL